MTQTPAPSRDKPAQLVVFDFDGTITTADTFALFIRYYAGTPRWTFNILKLLPKFTAYKLGMIDRHAVKAGVIKAFFKDQPIAKIEAKAAEFAKTVIPKLIRPAGLAEMKAKNNAPYTLYICSASIAPYLRAWARPHGVTKILAVELESEGGIATGRIDGYNVWGENKVRRIADEMGETRYEIVEAYGDTQGDRAMLAAAKVPFWRPFRT